jgi:hypothetical protein
MQQDSNFSTLPTRALITPRRFDLAVKWRYFKHLIEGNDPDSIRVYVWHIQKRSGARFKFGARTDQWKLSIDDYLRASSCLHLSMDLRGFDPSCAVPIDLDGELLNGSHRVACALALGIEHCAVRREKRYVFAPRWDFAWFRDHGMNEEDLSRLKADWEALTK